MNVNGTFPTTQKPLYTKGAKLPNSIQAGWNHYETWYQFRCQCFQHICDIQQVFIHLHTLFPTRNVQHIHFQSFRTDQFCFCSGWRGQTEPGVKKLLRKPYFVGNSRIYLRDSSFKAKPCLKKKVFSDSLSVWKEHRDLYCCKFFLYHSEKKILFLHVLIRKYRRNTKIILYQRWWKSFKIC